MEHARSRSRRRQAAGDEGAAPGDSNWQVPKVEAKGARKPAPSGGNWQVPKVEEKGAHPRPQRVAGLRLDTLSMASIQSSSANSTAYAANGTNLNRIKRVLSGAARSCAESCKQSCRTKFKESEVLKVCGLYWSLGQEEQAYLIQCLKEEAGCTASPVDTDRPIATRWAFGEKIVCFDAWCALLGTTKRTILKMVHGEDDERRSSSGRVPSVTSCFAEQACSLT